MAAFLLQNAEVYVWASKPSIRIAKRISFQSFSLRIELETKKYEHLPTYKNNTKNTIDMLFIEC